MGIEALAVFPAFVSIMAITIIIISGWRDVRHMFKTASFLSVLIVCTTAVLFATVFIIEFLGLSIVGELFYIGSVGFMLYSGLRYGRMKFDFTNRELILQGIIAFCGCTAIAFFFIGNTVKI